MGPFNNYVTIRGEGGLRYALRDVVTVMLKNVTKGGGGSKIVQKSITLLLNGPYTIYSVYSQRADVVGLLACGQCHMCLPQVFTHTHNIPTGSMVGVCHASVGFDPMLAALSAACTGSHQWQSVSQVPATSQQKSQCCFNVGPMSRTVAQH